MTDKIDLSSLISAKPIVVVEFDAEGRVRDRFGGFLTSRFLADSSIFDQCDFMFGVADTMSVGEELRLEGVHYQDDHASYILDVKVRCHSLRQFTMLIEDQTDLYQIINQVGQQRNEADIYHHRLARQNEQLTLLKQAAESASRERTEFLAKVSHEIRTPLNALLGFARMLDDTGLNRKQQRHLDHIHTAGGALSGLLNDLLDLSKMESGKYHIEAAPIVLSEVIENAAMLCKSKADEKALNLEWHTDPNIPGRLLGDSLRISQVILNLLTNAIKFTDEGTVTLRADCGDLSPVSVAVHFSVVDTGRGIPHEQQSQIFERFSQTQLADSTELGGVGLGLAIVRQLVEAMGGEISVKSEPGNGAQFDVLLPLKRLAETEDDTAERQNLAQNAKVDQRAATANSLADYNILIAEDSALNQQYVREILSPLGANLYIVESGRAAIQGLMSEPVDLILMDVHMPEMNGDEAIKKIRSDLLFPLRDIPIIVFTGKASESEQAALLDLGANQTLAKPYSPKVLLDAIARHKEKSVVERLMIDRLESDDISQDMIAIFKSEVPTYLRDLLIALFNQQEKQFVFHAHKMQSAMWVMELMDFYELLARLENEPLEFSERLEICGELCQGVEKLLSPDTEGND
ncbi:MAG: response regulator [Acidiferrobacterales bacterium]|nr:response regulator [Acidiferrobacterales bacterium]